MMRLIDAEKLLKKFSDGESDTKYEKDVNQVVRYIIKHSQTIDAVPVIRCYQCRASEPTDTSNTVFCKAWGRIVFKDGFCSYADKKESESNE